MEGGAWYHAPLPMCTARLISWLWIVFVAPMALAQVFAGSGSTREAMKNTVQNYKLHGAVPAGQFFRMAVVDGLLTGDLLADIPNSTTVVRVDVEGDPATWAVRKRAMAGAAAASSYISVYRYDFAAPEDGIWSISATIRSNYLTLYGRSGEGARGMSIRYMQNGNNITFTVSTIGAGAQNNLINATANSLKQLQSQHPEEVRKYLTPMLRAMSGRYLLRPGAADVYRVFDTIQPDSDTAARLEELLLKLDANSYKLREEATRELAAMGTKGVLAAVRRDLSDLPAEARNRLELFVSTHSTGLENVEAAREDGYFLLDCLDDGDLAVRKAALEGLQKLVKKPISLDVTLSGEALVREVERVRKSVDRLIRPTTRPATKPAA